MRRSEFSLHELSAAPYYSSPFADLIANLIAKIGVARSMEASFMSDATSQIIYFYNRHPISSEIILTKLRVSRGHLDGLRPEELFPHDQDHYGGLAATDELARGAQVSNGSRVADFCAGLGGTVRYLAHKYGADVTGIELTPARVSGAQELTRRVGLHDTARIVEGNVMDVPLPDASIDAVVSQEAFCHVPDVKRAVAEAFRILRTDGRLAFTDWTANQPLTAADAQLMGMEWPFSLFGRSPNIAVWSKALASG
jgi:sarcosine/dimethylglycine N-methyltransferase